MASTRTIYICFLLVLSLVAFGNCGHLVACKTSGAIVKSAYNKTASSPNYSYVSTVALLVNNHRAMARSCTRLCRGYCITEGPRGIEDWPNCKAFTSHLPQENGNRCDCYGWTTQPSWDTQEGYNGGWCENE